MNENRNLLISLKDVGLRYQKGYSIKNRKHKDWVLRNINLDIYHGESIGIIGENGAGKSTLLRLIAGLITPNEGQISKHKLTRTGLLALKAGFNSYLSGYDNIILKALYMGVSKAYIKSKINEVIELSGIGDSIYNAVNTYSSGMSARLGFAISYFCAPDLLLIDEALGVGDKAFKQKSKEMIANLVRSDRTVILVSHDEQTIESLCDRSIEIRKGQIIKG